MSEPDRQVKSEKLLSLTLACPECGTTMQATGKMSYNSVIKEWVIQYWCPSDRQVFNIYKPETADLAGEIAKEVSDQ